MKEQNISESNKLIAEFMGLVFVENCKTVNDLYESGDQLGEEQSENLWVKNPSKEFLKDKLFGCYTIWDKYGDDFTPYENYYYESRLKYHSSWDWLMPVVEKISRIPSYHSNGLYKYLCHVDINPIKGITIEGMYRRNFNAEDEIFIQIYEYSYLENTWLGVVEFIKWYNKNK